MTPPPTVFFNKLAFIRANSNSPQFNYASSKPAQPPTKKPYSHNLQQPLPLCLIQNVNREMATTLLGRDEENNFTISTCVYR